MTFLTNLANKIFDNLRLLKHYAFLKRTHFKAKYAQITQNADQTLSLDTYMYMYSELSFYKF